MTKPNSNEAPLSLVPEDDLATSKDNTDCATFKLNASPGDDANSPKYGFTMAKVDGTQTIRQHIKWVSDLNKVYAGLSIVKASSKRLLAEQMCSGAFKTAYINGVEKSINTRWNAKVMTAVNALERDADNNETETSFTARKLAAKKAVPKPEVEEDDLTSGVKAALTAVCPYKVLEKQKACMRRHMRKPQGMTTREYVNHLVRINEQEIIHLPPFRGTLQAFSEDELKDIITYGLPKSWERERVKFDFDLYRSSLSQLVDFCERLESSEDQNGHGKQDNKKGTNPPWKKSSNKNEKSSSKKPKEGGKWCDFHESDSHNTRDCHTLKKMKESRQADAKTKTWKSKAEQAKEKAKKELNTIKKKTI